MKQLKKNKKKIPRKVQVQRDSLLNSMKTSVKI